MSVYVGSLHADNKELDNIYFGILTVFEVEKYIPFPLKLTKRKRTCCFDETSLKLVHHEWSWKHSGIKGYILVSSIKTIKFFPLHSSQDISKLFSKTKIMGKQQQLIWVQFSFPSKRSWDFTWNFHSLSFLGKDYNCLIVTTRKKLVQKPSTNQEISFSVSDSPINKSILKHAGETGNWLNICKNLYLNSHLPSTLLLQSAHL